MGDVVVVEAWRLGIAGRAAAVVNNYTVRTLLKVWGFGGLWGGC